MSEIEKAKTAAHQDTNGGIQPLHKSALVMTATQHLYRVGETGQACLTRLAEIRSM